MEIPKERLEIVRAEAKRSYAAIGPLFCPYLNDTVHFRNDGFEHLIFKRKDKPRPPVEQYTRLRMLPLAEEVIRKSHTLQEHSQQITTIRQQSAGRWEKRNKVVNYYVFVAIIRPRVRIKVVVREIEGGTKHFYSLFPSWRVETDANGKLTKALYSDDPADL
jgi:hypothetical protein